MCDFEERFQEKDKIINQQKTMIENLEKTIEALDKQLME